MGERIEELTPPIFFDAHVHLGPSEVMGPLSPERRKLPLATFSHLTFEGAGGLVSAGLFGQADRRPDRFSFPFAGG